MLHGECEGVMSGCPAYLGVVINNRLELDELFRYDILILCPAEFNLTFKVSPHRQHELEIDFQCDPLIEQRQQMRSMLIG